MEKNIFEIATRNKIRFEFRGLISVEELFDLQLEELDSIFKKLSKEKKESSEESLLDTKTTENSLLETKIEIIKYIVNDKLERAERNVKAFEKAEKKQKIMSILSRKKDSELEEKSTEDLEEMLNSL